MRNQGGLNVAELCKANKTRRRTLYRDLQALDRAGFRIRHWYEGKSGLWACDIEDLPANRSFPSAGAWQATYYGGDT